MGPNVQVSFPRDGFVSIEIETEEDDEALSTGLLGENVRVLYVITV